MSDIKEQPEPKSTYYKPVWEKVIDDMTQRNKDGIEKYGTPLQPFNGRKALVDTYQEALDLTVYLKQKIIEDDITTRLYRDQEIATDEAIKDLGLKLDKCISALRHIKEVSDNMADAYTTADQTLKELEDWCDYCNVIYKECEC